MTVPLYKRQLDLIEAFRAERIGSLARLVAAVDLGRCPNVGAAFSRELDELERMHPRRVLITYDLRQALEEAGCPWPTHEPCTQG
jgi:hypothetical protein